MRRAVWIGVGVLAWTVIFAVLIVMEDSGEPNVACVEPTPSYVLPDVRGSMPCALAVPGQTPQGLAFAWAVGLVGGGVWLAMQGRSRR